MWVVARSIFKLGFFFFTYQRLWRILNVFWDKSWARGLIGEYPLRICSSSFHFPSQSKSFFTVIKFNLAFLSLGTELLLSCPTTSRLLCILKFPCNIIFFWKFYRFRFSVTFWVTFCTRCWVYVHFKRRVGVHLFQHHLLKRLSFLCWLLLHLVNSISWSHLCVCVCERVHPLLGSRMCCTDLCVCSFTDITPSWTLEKWHSWSLRVRNRDADAENTCADMGQAGSGVCDEPRDQDWRTHHQA